MIAYLSQLALSHPATADLFTEANSLIAQTLSADLVLIWKLDPARDLISLGSLSGWQAGGSRSSAPSPLGPDSFERMILESSAPVLVDDIKTETRFKPTELLRDAGAVSGIGVRIGTMDLPFGVVQVLWKQTQSITPENIHFLQGIAGILALCMDLEYGEAQRQDTEQLLKTQSAAPSGHVEWDRSEIKKHLMDSRERERLRLAQELHDIPIQDLYGLMYQLDELKDFVHDPAASEIVDEFNKTLHTVVNNLRAICAELRPPSLSAFGLEVAIRDHVDKLRKQFPEIEFHLDLMPDQQAFSDNMRLCLFRIYQQAINNIVRHAQSTKAYIRFRWDNQAIHLELEDNGTGFEVPQDWVDLVRQEQFGLVGIAERVESVHGKLQVVSTPAIGTVLHVEVPLR